LNILILRLLVLIKFLVFGFWFLVFDFGFWFGFDKVLHFLVKLVYYA